MRYAKLYWEDVPADGAMPPLVKAPIEQIQLTRYAGASGDFNPIHQDDAFAKAAGMGGVFAHGMLSMGFVAQSASESNTSLNVLQYLIPLAAIALALRSVFRQRVSRFIDIRRRPARIAPMAA